jgi:hypothetical protein
VVDVVDVRLILSKCAAGCRVANLECSYNSQHAACACAAGDGVAVIDFALNLWFCVRAGDATAKSKGKYKGGCIKLGAALQHAALAALGHAVSCLAALGLPVTVVAVNHSDATPEVVEGALGGGVEVHRVDHYRYFQPLRKQPTATEYTTRDDGSAQNSKYLYRLAAALVGGDKDAAYAAVQDQLGAEEISLFGLQPGPLSDAVKNARMTVRGADYAYFHELVRKLKAGQPLTEKEAHLAKRCLEGLRLGGECDGAARWVAGAAFARARRGCSRGLIHKF